MRPDLLLDTLVFAPLVDIRGSAHDCCRSVGRHNVLSDHVPTPGSVSKAHIQVELSCNLAA